jgi:uncharacterized membrane protein
LATAFVVVKDQEKRRIFVTLLAFHPAMLPYTLEGRSDIFMYSFLFVGFYLLYKNKSILAGIPLALAFAVKQSAWPLFPFYALYLFSKTKSIKKTVLNMVPFALIFLLCVLPFYMWDQKAFLDSTIGYLNGSVAHSYPVSGYGLGAVLLEFNIIKDKFAYYPFDIWQLVIGIPVLLGLLLYLRRQVSVQRLIIAYGIFLFVYWYFSRYFNNSHLAYISMILLSGYFWPENSGEIIEKKGNNKHTN